MTMAGRWCAVAAAVLLASCTSAAPPTSPRLQLTRPSETAPFDGTFNWTTIPEAKTYTVAVYAFDGSRKFEVRDLTGGGVKLSDGVQLPPGRYSVQITAMRDGAMVGETARIPFEVK